MHGRTGARKPGLATVLVLVLTTTVVGLSSTSNTAAPAGAAWIEGDALRWADGSTERWVENMTIGQAGNESNLQDGTWSTVSLSSDYFNSVPVVLTTTITTNGNQDPSDAQIKSVSKTGFDIRHCEYETSDSCNIHNGEAQSWIAIDPSKVDQVEGMKAGTVSVSNDNDVSVSFDSSFSNTPYVFAQIQTDNGEESDNIRIYSRSSSGFTLDYCEQEGTDSCDTSHSTETAGWVAIDPNVLDKNGIFDWGTASVSDSSWNSISFSQGYGSPPAIDVMVQTENGAQEAVYPEAKDLTSSGASVRYCEYNGTDNCDIHASETVAWWTAEVGKITVDGGVSTSGPKGAWWIEGSAMHWIDQNGLERSYTGLDTGNDPSALSGSAWIEGGQIHYIDASGNERKTSRPLIDNFEDGNLLEYDNGDTESIHIDSNDVYEGSYSVQVGNSTDGNVIFAWSSSGLGVYPSAGDKFRFYYKTKYGGSGSHNFRFAIQASDTYYNIYFKPWDSDFGLKEVSSGSGTTIQEVNYDYSGGNWYKIVVDWQSDGTITATLYDASSGSQEAQVSGTPSNTYDSGGVGYWTNNNNDLLGWIDGIKITG